MNATQEKPKSKKWIWIVVIVAALLACCCIAAAAGVHFYLQSEGKTVEDALSGGLLEPQADMPLPQTQEPSAGAPPDPTPTEKPPVTQAGEQMVVISADGVWGVDEDTGEAVQLSNAPLDAPWHPEEGVSPDGQAFAFITGFGGASMNPMLVVLDLTQQSQELELALTGPLSMVGNEAMPGDPAFEATRAMENNDSLAWSPDGRMLAFIAAIDGDSADVYLYDRVEGSVTRLSEEMGHAAKLHWSPDGRYIEYVSVESFGTGAGANMLSLWAIDMQTRETLMLERLESGAEIFLGWTDDSHFQMHSWGPACSGYNMRVVDAASGEQEMVLDSCFSAAAYNPRDKVGLMTVADFNVENCMCGTPLAEAALYVLFEDSEPLIMWYSDANAIDYLPEGNVFAFQPRNEPYAVYSRIGIIVVLPSEVTDLKPVPASPDGYWAWYSGVMSDAGKELWVTLKNENPVLVALHSSGKPAWSDDGQTLYYFNKDALYKASAPDFAPQAVPGVTGELLDVVN